MAKPAYLAQISTLGTPTQFTGEPMTSLGGNAYQITDTTKRVWDRATPPTFKDGNGAVIQGKQFQFPIQTPLTWGDAIQVDYLFGKATFPSAVVEPVTVDGKYMAQSSVLKAKSYNLDWASEILDATAYSKAQASGGYRSGKVYGLGDVSITLSRWHDADTRVRDALTGRSTLLLEIKPAASGGEVYRAWVVVESDQNSGDVGSIEEEQITLQLDGDAESAFSVGE